jgi:hypothetical protein
MEGNKKAVAPRWLLLLLLPKSHTSRENKTLFMIVKHRERERVVLKGIKMLCALVLCVPGIRYGWTAAACCRKSILCHVAGGETAKKIKQKGYAVST